MDADAAAYISAVETADGLSLPYTIKNAIDNFVTGCKADSIWSNMEACCLLAGPATLSGALVPLKGTAPTNNNFVSGDYDRFAGLIGNASTKYLDTNRAGNADGQNDVHQAVYVTVAHGNNTVGSYIGNGFGVNGATQIFTNKTGGAPGDMAFRNRSAGASVSSGDGSVLGFIGSSRSSSASYIARVDGADQTFSVASQTPAAADHFVFARSDSSSVAQTLSNARISFYSIGSSLTLSLLDSRITTYMSEILKAPDSRRRRYAGGYGL
jgi:hypothetical protein